MIPLYKLERLPAGQRRRKLVRLLTEWERRLYDLLSSFRAGETGGDNLSRRISGSSVLPETDRAWLLGICRLVLEDSAINQDTLTGADRQIIIGTPAQSMEISAQELLRLCNHARHALVHATGALPADWDFVHPVSGIPEERNYRSGMMVYAEDLRSPFNMGSVFRTAEAFGADRILLSPGCVSPEHPRSARSAMGCVDYLPWERCALEDLPKNVPVFALETGGTPLRDFVFPREGVVILGSEELGVSPEALERAEYGRVSIPMTGIKASINVGVAFGILVYAWADYLDRSASNAR